MDVFLCLKHRMGKHHGFSTGCTYARFLSPYLKCDSSYHNCGVDGPLGTVSFFMRINLGLGDMGLARMVSVYRRLDSDGLNIGLIWRDVIYSQRNHLLQA